MEIKWLSAGTQHQVRFGEAGIVTLMPLLLCRFSLPTKWEMDWWLCFDWHLASFDAQQNWAPLMYTTLTLLLTLLRAVPQPQWWMELCTLSDAFPQTCARSSWHRSVHSIEDESRQVYPHDGVKKAEPSWFIISSEQYFAKEPRWSWNLMWGFSSSLHIKCVVNAEQLTQQWGGVNTSTEKRW